MRYIGRHQSSRTWYGIRDKLGIYICNSQNDPLENYLEPITMCSEPSNAFLNHSE